MTNKKTCDKVGDMNKQQFKADMEKLIRAVKADNEKSDKLYEYCGGMVESWCMDLAAGLMDRIYSPKDNWISWWVWETDMGKSKMKAGYDKNAKIIKTVEDLWWLICEEEKR